MNLKIARIPAPAKRRLSLMHPCGQVAQHELGFGLGVHPYFYRVSAGLNILSSWLLEGCLSPDDPDDKQVISGERFHLDPKSFKP